MPHLTERPDPGARLAYRADGGIHTGVVLHYERGSGVTFPVRDDNTPLERMMLPCECVPVEEWREFVRSGRIDREEMIL